MVKPKKPTSTLTSATLQDSKHGWLHLVALFYGFAASILGLALLAGVRNGHSEMSLLSRIVRFMAGIFFSSHGRVIAAYLIHEATHSNIFQQPVANQWFGRVAIWAAGCPYVDFDHVKRMHMSHHHDRADTVEFDYRDFLLGSKQQQEQQKQQGWSNAILAAARFLVRNLVLTLEFCFVPVVETIMHTRSALYPIFFSSQVTQSRCKSALIGTPAILCFYFCLYWSSCFLLISHFISGAVMLQYLALNDAFHHTYEAIIMAEYVPGPGPRTAQYEEENTYSNLISIDYPIFNLLSLNFGYHNAHHKRASTPWYKLPQLHQSLYHKGSQDHDSTTAPQVLSFYEIVGAWHRHRLKRVIQYDYGVVGAPGTAHRARDFVGALGVSFLTV